MKVFISWSGNQSKEIASVFKEWIPGVIQAVKPYFSPSDIDKGSRWSNEIAIELESAKFGLICLTKDNLDAPWLMFEAGALSKSIDGSRVCPMLFGINAADLSGPLVQFQAAPFSKDEVLKVVKSINSQLGDNSLDSMVLESVFAKWWPDLETKITQILSKMESKNDKEIRTDRELLEEILRISRRVQVEDRTERFAGLRVTSNQVVQQLIEQYLDVTNYCLSNSLDTELLDRLNKLSQQMLRTIGRQLPLEILRKYLSEADSISQTIEEKIDEINETPF